MRVTFQIQTNARMRVMFQIQTERAKTVKVTIFLIKFHFEVKKPKKYCSTRFYQSQILHENEITEFRYFATKVSYHTIGILDPHIY